MNTEMKGKITKYKNQILLNDMIPALETDVINYKKENKYGKIEDASAKFKILDTSRFDEYSFTKIDVSLYLNESKRFGKYFTVQILPYCDVSDSELMDGNKAILYKSLKMFAQSKFGGDSYDKCNGMKSTGQYKKRCRDKCDTETIRYISEFENMIKMELKSRIKNRKMPWFFTSVFKHQETDNFFCDKHALCAVIKNDVDDDSYSFDIFLRINKMYMKCTVNNGFNLAEGNKTYFLKGSGIISENYRNDCYEFSVDDLDDVENFSNDLPDAVEKSSQDEIDLSCFDDL